MADRGRSSAANSQSWIDVLQQHRQCREWYHMYAHWKEGLLGREHITSYDEKRDVGWVWTYGVYTLSTFSWIWWHVSNAYYRLDAAPPRNRRTTSGDSPVYFIVHGVVTSAATRGTINVCTIVAMIPKMTHIQKNIFNTTPLWNDHIAQRSYSDFVS